MADFYTAGQLAYKLGLSEEELTELLAKAAFSPRVKDGREYYSAQQAYQLRAALRLARKHKMSLEDAFMRFRGRRLYQVEVSGD